MRVAVLDYASGSVNVFDAPDYMDGQNLEQWLCQEHGFSPDTIAWMSGVQQINIE